MDIVSNIIKLLFGSKADKDRKAIEPYVNKIKEIYPSISALSNDELRARSQALMKRIADFIAPDEERIVSLKAQLERPETELSEKEKISKEIDEITKRIDDKIEQVLDEILPEAFAIMKDTARRFTENERIEVTATDFDRQLAADIAALGPEKAALYREAVCSLSPAFASVFDHVGSVPPPQEPAPKHRGMLNMPSVEGWQMLFSSRRGEDDSRVVMEGGVAQRRSPRKSFLSPTTFTPCFISYSLCAPTTETTSETS